MKSTSSCNLHYLQLLWRETYSFSGNEPGFVSKIISTYNSNILLVLIPYPVVIVTLNLLIVFSSHELKDQNIIRKRQSCSQETLQEIKFSSDGDDPMGAKIKTQKSVLPACRRLLFQSYNGLDGEASSKRSTFSGFRYMKG